MIFTPLAGSPVSARAMSVIFATSSAVSSPVSVDTTTLTLSAFRKATQSAYPLAVTRFSIWDSWRV